MKKGGIIAVLLFVYVMGWGQKNDNNWFYGSRNQDQNNPAYPLRGNGQISFAGDTFQTWAQFRTIPFSETNSSISDGDGNLLFFTNGMRILDSTNQIIENGDSLNYGDAWEHFENETGVGTYGMSIFSGLYIVPTPGNDSSYTIIHIRNDSLSPSYWSGKVCYTVVVKKSNGSFKVKTKNVPFSNIAAPVGNMAITKHANGRDWWIVFPEKATNCFYKYLLTPDTIQFISTQCLGNSVTDIDIGASKFSPNGEKYFRHGYYAGIEVFDFDRCNGELSNMLPLTLPQMDSLGDPISSGIPEFSPDGRFVYAPRFTSLFQWDLDTTDVAASMDSVGETDSFLDTILYSSGSPWSFYLSQIGPDGKIYFGGSPHRFYSVINHPDIRGVSSEYCHRCIVLPKQSPFTLSCFPNYRLGRLIGSACDTVYSDVKPIYNEKPWLKVFPNPASDEVQFDYNWIEWDKIGNCELQITDMSGKVVFQQPLPKYSTRQNVSVKQLAAGVYYVAVKRAEQTVAVSKFVKNP